MKKDTHPTMNPVIFRDAGAGVDFIGTSTSTSETKEVVNGVEHHVITVEISSASHPFFTGEENVVDSAGRIEKFLVRAGKKAEKGKRQKVGSADVAQTKEESLQSIAEEQGHDQ